ncbi:MAG: glycosyltransferase family 4 protein [Melioribacteraceae bacterium]
MNKVAYFLNIYPKTSETFIQREIDNLQKIGYEVVIFAIRRNKKLRNTFDLSKAFSSIIYAFPESTISSFFLTITIIIRHPVKYLKCIMLILKNLSDQSIPVVSKQFILLYYSARYVYKLRSEKIHHIHSHFSNASSIALFCKILNPQLKFGFTAHASADIYQSAVLLVDKMKYCNYVIAISEYNERYLNLVSDNIYKSKIKVVFNGVELKEKRSSKSFGKCNDRIKFISVGDFTFIKGYPTLIEAARIIKNRGYKFLIEIIGSGKQMKTIQELISENDLFNEVKLLGEIPNTKVISKISEYDVFVLPSEIYMNGKRDGMPTAIIEAMSCGIPVISTYISGIPEIVVQHTTGILVRERDPVELSNAMIELIENSDLRDRLSENAYSLIERKFNILNTVREIDKVFRQSVYND